jgi:hypothetical protein
MLTQNEVRECMGFETIRSLAYLKECISWNLDGNFDRVSAGNMLFIARADKYKTIQSNKFETTEVDEYANDPFLSQNFNPYSNSFTNFSI